jgi:hypothetical protein
MAFDHRKQYSEGAAVPRLASHDRQRSALLGHLPVRVRIVECANGIASEAKIAASFAEEGEAEAFIRSKVANDKSFRFDTGRHWGETTAGDQVCYWIETDQETASVKNAHRPT